MTEMHLQNSKKKAQIDALFNMLLYKPMSRNCNKKLKTTQQDAKELEPWPMRDATSNQLALKWQAKDNDL